MTDDEDFTLEWSEPLSGKGTITNVRVTRGKALHRLPWWQRWLMPWRRLRFYRKPITSFPSTEDQP